MKIINNVTINTTPMPSVAISKPFLISGDPGAVFNITVTNEDNHYYNFSEEIDKNGLLITPVAFTATPTQLFQKTIDDSGVYNGIIQFPAITDDDEYNITVFADPYSETVFEETLSLSNTYSLPTIYKYKDTTLTFSLKSVEATGGDNNELYNVFPSNVTSVGFSSSLGVPSSKKTFSISWPLTLNDDGFKILRQPVTTDFEFSTTKTTKTAKTNSKFLELTDITGLSIGMTVSAVGIPTTNNNAGTTTITDINKGYLDISNSSNLADVYSIPTSVQTINGVETVIETTGGTVTLATGSDFVVDRVVTFIGSGSSNTEVFNNTLFHVSNFKLVIDPVVTTTTAAVAATATVIPVTNANGILSFSVVTGIGVNSENAMIVTGISSQNITVRALVAADGEAIESGQTLTFTGSSRSALVTADVTVDEYGIDDLTLSLDLDNILTIE